MSRQIQYNGDDLQFLVDLIRQTVIITMCDVFGKEDLAPLSPENPRTTLPQDAPVE
jgi:hypothetical protein